MLSSLNADLKNFLEDKNILITGGTGTFGHEITRVLLTKYNPKKVIIFSRDEFKQYNMKKIFPEDKFPNIRFFIGDVRDYDRLKMATKDVNILFHAAAMKQVDTIEYNPLEAIKTNVYGTENVIKAAIENNLERVIGISTDKCVSPTNLYGASKLCLEKIILHANVLSGENGTIFSVLRYGNVMGSRGSVIPVFLKQKEQGYFTITHPEMTRFTLTIEEAIIFVLNCSVKMIGGEIFVPKLPSYSIMQLAKCIDPSCEIKITGLRPGEKLHESMISDYETGKIIEKEDYYIILPESNHNKNFEKKHGNTYRQNNDEYSSGKNVLIDDQKLIKLIEQMK